MHAPRGPLPAELPLFLAARLSALIGAILWYGYLTMAAVTWTNAYPVVLVKSAGAGGVTWQMTAGEHVVYVCRVHTGIEQDEQRVKPQVGHLG